MKRKLTVVALLSVGFSLCLHAQAPVRCDGPLSEARLIQLIQGDVAEARIRQYIQMCGTGFILDKAAERRLREAGATAGILDAVRVKAATAGPSNAELRLQAELALWKAIEASVDPSLFQDYLEKYPSGQFAVAARARLRAIQAGRLRARIRQLLEARERPQAQTTVEELLALVPEDAEAIAWKKRIADEIAEERAVAERTNSLGMEFVLIRPGSFTMGCSPADSECEGDERPVHRVEITRLFQLGKYEVTQGEWEQVMGTNPSSHKSGPRNPVENVSWGDIREFLSRLNSRNDGWLYRLPREAEWEYAARAGTTAKHLDQSLDEIAWYSNNSGGQTHPVGEKKENAWHLHDMLGNVWEWCEDWYDENYYGSSPGADPLGPASGQYRALRGGSWVLESRNSRVSYRLRLNPDFRNFNVGFRVARERK